MTFLFTILSVLLPYLQNPQPTQMTIMWPSTNAQQTGWVEYGMDNLNQVARESNQGLFAAFNDINRVTLSGLQPNTTYRYRVAVANIVGEVRNTSLTYGDTLYSEIFQFTTPERKPKDVSCLFFDDIHSRDTLVKPLLQTNAIDAMQQDFVFFNGDILNAIPNRDEIVHHMIQPFSSLFTTQVPFLYTRGNHELRNKYARELDRYVTTPGTDQGHPFYYSFTWGPVFFIVMDAGEDKEDSDKEYKGLLDCQSYRESQVAWLEQQLKSKIAKQASFRVLVMHVPFYSNTQTARYTIGESRRLYMDLCNRYNVDVAICGHTHKAGIIEANQEHHFPIVIGGGKDVTEDKRAYCPAVVQLHADSKQLDINIWNYYKENCGTVHLNK